MTTPRYLTVGTFKQWWKTETTIDDSLIEAAINAAETAIDNALQRRMVVASGTPSERVFRPDGSDILYFDDCVSVTSIVENSTTLTSGTHFVLEPFNNLSATGETWPYYRAIRYAQCWYTDGPKATVTIDADWGWSAIPFEVVESCKIIAADMLSNRDMRNGLVAITEVGGVGSRDNMTVKNMVAKYRGPAAYLQVA